MCIRDRHGHVDSKNGQHATHHNEDLAAGAIEHKDVLQHPGDHEIGQQRPLGNQEKTIPGKISQSRQQDHVGHYDDDGKHEQYLRETKGRMRRQMSSHEDTACDDEGH